MSKTKAWRNMSPSERLREMRTKPAWSLAECGVGYVGKIRFSICRENGQFGVMVIREGGKQNFHTSPINSIPGACEFGQKLIHERLAS